MLCSILFMLNDQRFYWRSPKPFEVYAVWESEVIVASILCILFMMSVMYLWLFLNFFFLYNAGFCAARSSFIYTSACSWCPGFFCRGALLNYYDAIMTSIRIDFFIFVTLLLNMCAWLQVFLARGLQLEKTTKAANVQYILVLFPLLPPKQLAALPTFKSILPERYQ